MANTKFSALTAATTPLTGAEVLAGVQGGANRKVSADSLWRKSGGLWVPPASPSAYDDEFNAATLDAKWTASAGASVGGVNIYDGSYATADGWRYQLDLRPGWLVAQAAGHNSYGRGITQTGIALPTNAFIYMRIQALNRGNAGYGNRDGECILGWYDGNDGAFIARDNNRVLFQKQDGGGFSDVGTISLAMPEPVEYLGLGKVGQSFSGWAAGASGTWVYIGAATLAGFTGAADFNITFRNAAAYTTPGLLAYGIDFFRYQANSATPPWP